MRIPTTALRVVSVAPAVLVSFLLTVAVLALLPPPLGLLGLLLMLGVLVALAIGLLQREAIPVLTKARTMTVGERNVLAGVFARLVGVGVEVGPMLLVRRVQRPTTPAAAVVGGSLVVSPALVDGVHRGGVSPDEAAALIAHAVGEHRGVHPRLEVAGLAALTPWRMVMAVVRRVAAAFSWLPFVGTAWTLRGVIGVVCVIQGAVEGHLVPGLLGGLVIALTYAMPAANRALERQRETAADAYVIQHGLGRVLATLLRRLQWPTSLDRLQQLDSGADPTPGPALRLVGT